MSDKLTFVCRCSDVTLADVRAFIAKGYHTVDEVKRVARVGMGPCQGKTCAPLIQREIEQMTGKKIGNQPLPTVRPPLRGVKLSVLAGGERCED